MTAGVVRRFLLFAFCFTLTAGCKVKATGDSNSAPTDDSAPMKKEGNGKTSVFEWVGGQSPFQLASRESVRADLGVTADQYAVIQQAEREQSAKMSAARKELNEQTGKPGNRADLKGIATTMRALNEAVQKALTEKQFKRLEQIAMQYRVHHHGVLWLFNRKSVQEKIGLTESQLQMVTTLASDEARTIDEVRRSRSPGAVKPMLDRFYQDANEKLLGSLSNAQRAKWQEVLGPPFDLAAGGFTVKK